jgi:hypothetical protein
MLSLYPTQQQDTTYSEDLEVVPALAKMNLDTYDMILATSSRFVSDKYLSIASRGSSSLTETEMDD